MRYFAICLLLGILLTSCATVHSLSQGGFRPAVAPAMPFTPPLVEIGVISEGNKPQFDGEATAASVALLRRRLLAHQAELRLSGELAVPDSLRPAAGRELAQAVESLHKRTRLTGGANLPVLDYLLQQQGQRYVLVPVAQGFTRRPGNYAGQIAKDIAVGVLSMGTMVPMTVKANSHISLFVYDSQQHAIVYLTRTHPRDGREPLNEASVEKQLRQILRRDYPFVPRP